MASSRIVWTRSNYQSAKTWRPKLGSNVPEVWESTTQKGPWIFDEKSKATGDQLQIENDKLFEENLQASDHSQFNDYDENDEDNYNPAEQKKKTYEKNEISFDGDHETELTHIRRVEHNQRFPARVTSAWIDRKTQP